MVLTQIRARVRKQFSRAKATQIIFADLMTKKDKINTYIHAYKDL